MSLSIQPLQVQSLKAACVERLEQKILSGELQIGERLPPEREFAARLGVSRPVLHAALVELDSRGLVHILPRRGAFVSDFRREGSVSLLASLLAAHDGRLDPAFVQSLMDMRLTLEVEIVRQAALHRTEEQLGELESLVGREAASVGAGPDLLTELDFAFHLLIAIASANLVYPMIVNSFRPVYTRLTGEFFRRLDGTPVVAQVHEFHRQLLEAVRRGSPDDSGAIMLAMLRHGEAHLKGARP